MTQAIYSTFDAAGANVVAMWNTQRFAVPFTCTFAPVVLSDQKNCGTSRCRIYARRRIVLSDFLILGPFVFH
jgi:hypothetical protein